MTPTPQQIANREYLKGIITTRKDKPLKYYLIGKEGVGHCFVGLCYEAMRSKFPDKYHWDNSNLIHNHPVKPYQAGYDACEHLKEWLGISGFILIKIMRVNDHEPNDLSWEEMWDQFENLLKGGNNATDSPPVT